jgi:hypothetical protein
MFKETQNSIKICENLATKLLWLLTQKPTPIGPIDKDINSQLTELFSILASDHDPERNYDFTWTRELELKLPLGIWERLFFPSKNPVRIQNTQKIASLVSLIVEICNRITPHGDYPDELYEYRKKLQELFLPKIDLLQLYLTEDAQGKIIEDSTSKFVPQATLDYIMQVINSIVGYQLVKMVNQLIAESVIFHTEKKEELAGFLRKYGITSGKVSQSPLNDDVEISKQELNKLQGLLLSTQKNNDTSNTQDVEQLTASLMKGISKKELGSGNTDVDPSTIPALVKDMCANIPSLK